MPKDVKNSYFHSCFLSDGKLKDSVFLNARSSYAGVKSDKMLPN